MRPSVKIALLLFSLLVLAVAGSGIDAMPRFPPDAPTWRIWQTPTVLRRVGERLKEWHEKEGRWSTNADGLAVLGPGSERAARLASELTSSGQLAPGPANPYPLGFAGGRMSPLLVPIVYENRNEGAPGAFDRFDSGRDDWWIEPAPGVVLWAPEGPVVEADHAAAKARYARLAGWKIVRYLLAFSALVAAVGLAVSLLRRRRPAGRIHTPGGLAAKLGIAILAAQAVWIGCGPAIDRSGLLHTNCHFTDGRLPVRLRGAAVREWERSLDERVAAGVIPASEREARLDAFAAAEAALLPPGKRVAAPRPPR